MKSGEPMTKSSFRRFWYNILDKMNVAAGGDEFSRSDTAIRLIAKTLHHIYSVIHMQLICTMQVLT